MPGQASTQDAENDYITTKNSNLKLYADAQSGGGGEQKQKPAEPVSLPTIAPGCAHLSASALWLQKGAHRSLAVEAVAVGLLEVGYIVPKAALSQRGLHRPPLSCAHRWCNCARHQETEHTQRCSTSSSQVCPRQDEGEGQQRGAGRAADACCSRTLAQSGTLFDTRWISVSLMRSCLAA